MDEFTTSCVLLADRHHGLSEGIHGLLESVFSTVFMVTDEASLVEGARRLRPSVIVADLSLVPGDSLGFVRRLREQAGDAKLVLLSVHDELAVAQSVIAAGADGIVLKRSIATDLLPAIESLLGGSRYVSPAIASAFERAADKTSGFAGRK
jgi:DNA-binding NarL/FixJ family response regulator